MIKFIKGVFKDMDHGITEWDEPAVRFRQDGTRVVGRPTRGFGSGGTFSYAGKDYEPEPYNEKVGLIKKRAEELILTDIGLGVECTFCLAGLYPTGEDGIPFHSDTVPELDDLVVSISFGAPRIFRNRIYTADIKDHSNTSDVNHILLDNLHNLKAYKDYDYLMEHGDCIIFNGNSQMNSMHEVPSVIGVGERVNLTFRTGL